MSRANERGADATPMLVEELQQRLNHGERRLDLQNVFAPDWTPPDPVCRDVALALFDINPNLFAPDAFPTVAHCLSESLAFLAGVFSQSSPCGQLVSGSTEGLLVSMEAASRHFDTRDMQVIAPVSAHHSLWKVLHYRGVAPDRVTWVGVDSEGRPSIEAMVEAARRCSPAFVFTTVGTVDLGTADPVASIANECASSGAWIHVDAASAGMVLPFIGARDIGTFDFRLPEVRSLTVDVHKRGLAPLPCSFVLFRDQTDLELLNDAGPYSQCLGARPGFTGSFPGISAAWAWALFAKHGQEGYAQIAEKTMGLADRVRTGIAAQGVGVFSGTRLPMAVVPVADGAIIASQLFDEYGIWVEYSVRPCGRSDDVLRIGVMPHNTDLGADQLMSAIGELLL